ncbi:MAG: glycosyltransferase [Gammaproteobacteria bacterium]
MLVSIIIINYNYQAYLSQAIESALGQSYPHIEVIVIDDGSSDNSVEIIKRYGDKITPILKQNSGHCSCINLGYSKSQGDVVIFLDADDLLYESAVALHVENLTNPAVIKSTGYQDIVDSAGQLTGRLMPGVLGKSGNYRDITLSKGLDIYRPSFTSGNAWSRKFLQQVMPIPDQDPIDNMVGPDGYLTAVDVLFGDVASIHQSIGQYRIHGSNCGPVNFCFSARYMQKRLLCRQTRIRYAEKFAQQLGLQIPDKPFYQLYDWKLNLMQQSLVLMGESTRSAPLWPFVHSPFIRRQGNTIKATMTSMAFLLVRILPAPISLKLANYLLSRW